MNKLHEHLSLVSSELLGGATVHSSNPEGLLFKSSNDRCNLLCSNKIFLHQTKRNIALFLLAESGPHITH